MFHIGTLMDIRNIENVGNIQTLETLKTVGTSKRGRAPITATTGEGHQSRQQPWWPLSIYLFIYLCMYAIFYLAIVFLENPK
jgi:hypothetical protein